jgi:hypothetical protein
VHRVRGAEGMPELEVRHSARVGRPRAEVLRPAAGRVRAATADVAVVAGPA